MFKKSLLLTLLLALLVPWAAKAQDLADYTFSTGTDEDQWITLSSSATSIVASGDDKVSALTNIGFTFPFGNGAYTKFWANSNGIFSFNSTPATSYSTQFSSSSNLSANQPKICGITRDMCVPSSGGYVKYELTGTKPNRVLVCEFNLGATSSASSASVNWQVQLHESGSKVVIVYGAAASPSSFQIGLSQSTTDIWLVNPGTHTTTHYTTYNNTTYATWPGENRYYEFAAPYISCPKPSDLEATLTPGDGTVATLSWTAGGTETAWVLEYGTTSDFTGATSVNVTGGTPSKDLSDLTAETKYYARVKADCGGGDTSNWSATCEFTPTDQLIIPILGTTGSTNSYLPSNTNYDYAYTQQIYTAAEMGGFPCTLKSVAFKGNKAAVCDLDIYLANTDKTSFTSTTDYIAISEATLVFSGEVTFIADDWKTITFDNDFDYTGGNLAIIVDDNSGNYDFYTTTWQTFNTTGKEALYFYQDDTNINPSSPSAGYSGTLSVKNQIKFDYELPSPYVKPQNLAVTNLTATTATITWEAPNSDVQSYKYQYREAGGSWSALTSTTALSAPLTSLTGNTTYEFQVQAIYAGNNESAFATKDFTTPCPPFAITYGYGFEDESELDCWTILNPVDNTDYGYQHQNWGETGIINNSTSYSFGSSYARTGDNCFLFTFTEYPDVDPQYQSLISPQITGIANGLHVEFWYRQYSNGVETFRVGYSTTDKNISSFTWGNQIDNLTGEYQRFSANYPAETKYVAIQHTSNDQYMIFIDDFTFEESASCLEPTDVTADNITTTSADITWTNGGEESAWDIYVTTDETIVPDENTTPTEAGITVKPHPLIILTPASRYYVYVRSACSATETSAWSTPYVFDSDCLTEDLPYSYGFENTDQYNICWNTINTNTSYLSLNINTNVSNAHTGTNSLNYYRGSSTGTMIAVLPEFDANYPLNEYEITFWGKGSGTFAIGIMTDPNDASTFVKQGENISLTGSYTQYLVRFNGYTGNGQYIGIKEVSTSNVGGSYIDDIEINHLPSCFEPEGLAVTSPTAHGATFAWTNGSSESEWHLYFSKENTAPADDISLSKVTVADSNPFTVTTGLDAETDYYVWVRANCGTDDYSVWVGPETFTTDVACPAPTGLTPSEITNHTAKLSWSGTSDGYNVRYRTAETIINPIFNETFESNSIPTGWGRSNTELTNNVLNGTTTISSYSGGWITTTYGLGQYNVKMNIWNTSKYWLITPSKTIGANNILNFDAAITKYNNSVAPDSDKMPDANSRFVVLITTDDQATWTILREWNNTGSADVLNNITNTAKNFTINLSSYEGETVKIAFYGGQTVASDVDCDLHIDNVIIGTSVAAGAWQNKTADASPYTATGLDPETKYEAQVQGNCSGEGLSQWSVSKFFTTDIACPAPTALTPSNPTSMSFDLQWTNGGSENWVLAYKKTGDEDFTEIDLTSSDVLIEGNLITYTLSGLDAEQEYTVKVRDNCEPSYTGDGVSEWTAELTYSTIPACSAINPVVSNITHHNATVNWEGESATGFTVNYRTAASINGTAETFDGSSAPTGWEVKTGLLSDIMGGGVLSEYAFPYWGFGTSNGVFNNHASLNIYGSSCKSWLISPEIEVSDGYGLSFDLALTDYNGSVAVHTGTCVDDRFVVVIYVDGNWAILCEWNNSGSTYVFNNISYDANGENVIIDLGDYKNKTARIAFYGESTTSGNGDNNLHIDNVLIGPVVAAGAWQTQAAATTTAELSGLTAGTLYDVKVVPNCDPTLESETKQFKTMASNIKHFLTAGDWGTASNWLDNEIPAITDKAILHANAIINNGTVATTDNITFEGSPTPTLTINDGGQLKHNNTSSINATVKKTINGYGSEQFSTNKGYVLLAEPINYSITVYDTDITYGIRTGIYDLYRWDRTSDLEWTNYGSNSNNSSSLSMSRGTGYLYASQDDRELTFTGNIYGSGIEYSKSVSYTAPGGSTEYADFNLIGNPFVCDAYLADDGGTPLAYYKMNDAGDDFETVTGEAIAPMQGVFYQATADSTVYFYRELPSTSVMPGTLNIQVAQVVNSRDARRTTDNAIIRFGEGNTLEKFSFNADNAKIYIPQGGKDYAVANAENAGEMPVYFKAAENGSYTVDFTARDVEFSYLHLIDNMTGNDVNLLETPSYSFDARTIDYASRFKLVFATGLADMGDDFGFFDANGNLAILGIEGTATLQVIDVTGRILSSETFSGNYSKAVNAKAGVYMLRLIQGNDVRTQKIVVK